MKLGQDCKILELSLTTSDHIIPMANGKLMTTDTVLYMEVSNGARGGRCLFSFPSKTKQGKMCLG